MHTVINTVVRTYLTPKLQEITIYAHNCISPFGNMAIVTFHCPFQFQLDRNLLLCLLLRLLQALTWRSLATTMDVHAYTLLKRQHRIV